MGLELGNSDRNYKKVSKIRKNSDLIQKITRNSEKSHRKLEKAINVVEA